MSKTVKAKSPYIFVVAIAFILAQSLILLNSFPAIYRIYTDITSNTGRFGSFWTSFWFLSEITGEIGLIIRFAGACLLIAFAWALLRRKDFSFSLFRKAVLLEGVYYLFYIPFIILLSTVPANAPTALTFRLTAISYTIQTILISSSFIMLYTKTRHPKAEHAQLFRWSAIAVVNYIFALWVKHFLFNLYALPIDMSSPLLLVGLLNSTLPMLAAAVILLITFMPIIRGQTTNFNSKAAGIAFILVGTYFILYLLVSLVNSSYLTFLPLIELWAITFAALGVGLLKERSL